MNTQKQHVDLYRKLLLRRRLYSEALPGAAYVPFCGDGDIAFDVYKDRKLYMADLDPERVHKAQGRLPSASIKVGNCNSWLFGLIDEPFSIADFDAYSNPYPAFVSFWLLANKANRIILFGTDGQRQRIKRSKCTKRLPDGAETPATMIEYRTQYNFWWKRFVLPFLEITIAPYRIIRSVFYIRQDMLYWGVVASL